VDFDFARYRGFINSVQNGLLLRSDIHQLFHGHDVSINPDVHPAV
jgi:hypothetical protein